MRADKANALAAIDESGESLIALSDAIWSYAELSLNETQSASAYERALREAGFAVEKPFCGVETAVYGAFGSGAPHIGILAEYDALAGLSQQGGKTHALPVAGRDEGHGCGHNLLGAGAFGAALAIKRYLQTTGCSGTVHFYGCPGEEGCASKAFFAKRDVWRKLDAALTWHPDDCNEIATGSCMACIQTLYRFAGTASHAAGSPELGRSALDAAALMNLGVQFLREHMPRTASVHYALVDAGGASPNVVQAHAGVLYMVRERDMHAALQLQKRVDEIARGASIMTETQVRARLIDCCSNVVPNRALEEILYANFEQLGVPAYTKSEWAFACALRESYLQNGVQPAGIGARQDEQIAALVSEKTQDGARALNDFLMPPFFSTAMEPGSTDVGDVSWQTPTAQIHVVTAPSNCPGHSWQNVSSGKTSIAHKGMLHAARVLAAAAIDLIADPALLNPVRAEFEKRTASGYVNPMPEGFTLQSI